MQHFITFLKRKALALTKGDSLNFSQAHMLNHELMNFGYVLSKEAFEVVESQTSEKIQEIYNDLISGIRDIVGEDGHEAIYTNFPQAVLQKTHFELYLNAILHYWSWGEWRPSESSEMRKQLMIEPVKFKEIGLMDMDDFNNIFYDIVYANTSISKVDIDIIKYFINHRHVEVDLDKIPFNENLAIIGSGLIMLGKDFNTKDATNVLRAWAAYSGGDSGLKNNTKFKSPTNTQRRMLLGLLENSHNLEDSFKTYREKWLRMLFLLHPQTKANAKNYPNVAKMADALRNNPKTLTTFNAKVEKLIADKDEGVFKLLSKRMGVFTRRLDHLVRVFGENAITHWVDGKPNFKQLISIYNHFNKRTSLQSRTQVIANSERSQMVVLDGLEPLSESLVSKVLAEIKKGMAAITSPELVGKKTYVSRNLYFRPLVMNNRANHANLMDSAMGETTKVDVEKTIRFYVHWHTHVDIDLSGYIINTNGAIEKIGWNSRYYDEHNAVVYSGDNTGYSDKNAEYLDITPSKFSDDAEWVIVDARFFRPRQMKFNDSEAKVKMGWMLREYPDANKNWLPQTLDNAVNVNCDASSCVLMAYHVPSSTVVYLGISSGDSNVSNSKDAENFLQFINSYVTIDEGGEISWDRLNQGHVLELLSDELVDNVDDADVVYDFDTKWERVARLI